MSEQQTPTPIDPADIRPGDVVERVIRMTVARRTSADLNSTAGYAYSLEDDATWHLVHRPDPDAEVIEAMAKAIHEASFFTKWDEVAEDARDELRRRARVALAVVREHDAKRADQ